MGQMGCESAFYLLELSSDPGFSTKAGPLDDGCPSDPSERIQQSFLASKGQGGVLRFDEEYGLEQVCQYARENVYVKLLISPVKLRPERNVYGILEVLEHGLDGGLAPVASDDLGR